MKTTLKLEKSVTGPIVFPSGNSCMLAYYLIFLKKKKVIQCSYTLYISILVYSDTLAIIFV